MLIMHINYKLSFKHILLHQCTIYAIKTAPIMHIHFQTLATYLHSGFIQTHKLKRKAYVHLECSE